MAAIIIPLILGGIHLATSAPDLLFGKRVFLNKKNEVFYSILTFLLTPFHSIILHCMRYRVERLLEFQLKTKSLLSEWTRINYHLAQNIKLELGMEAIFQLSGQLILYLNAVSKTKTSEGFDAIFKEDDFLLETLLIISFLWSLKSCVFAHIKGLSARRVYFPVVSKAIAIVYSLLACSMRVLSFVVFFTPAFGLFSVLQHLKSEQMPWHSDLKENFVEKDRIQFGNSTPINWNDIDRWKTGDKGNLIPPDLTLYTIFTLKEYFFIFWIILTFQAAMVFSVIHKWGKEDFGRLNYIEKFIHVVENCLIPCNVMEWENITAGNSEAHRKKMKANQKEILLILIVNFIFNCILLSPLCILGNTKQC